MNQCPKYGIPDMTVTKTIGTLCIRADADASMGIGHVMRCLALAQAWQDRGGRVFFISTMKTVSLLERLRQENMELIAITATPGSEADLNQTVAAAHAQKAAWIVLDGYHFTREFMLSAQQAGLHLLILDDVADRDLSGVEAVLNQNAYANDAMHQHFAPCPELLLGAPYTLIRREFLRPSCAKQIRAEAGRVLITLGGADVPNATLNVMRALQHITFRRLEVRLVIGAANRHIDTLQTEMVALLEFHEAEFLINPPNMPELMSWSDVTITAAGSSCWELCCLGVPQLILVTADNQRLMPAYFIEHDIAEVFGELDDTRTEELAQRLAALLLDTPRRMQLSRTALSVIDGGGAQRVVNFMLSHS